MEQCRHSGLQEAWMWYELPAACSLFRKGFMLVAKDSVLSDDYDAMKKPLLVFILLLCMITSLPAADWAVDIALGVPMYASLTCRTGAFGFELAADTSFGPGGLLALSLMDSFTLEDMTPLEKFSYGSSLLCGLSAGVYWYAFDTSSFSLLLGSDVTALHASSRDGVVNHFTKGDTVLFNAVVKTAWNFGRSAIFMKAGFPLFGYFNYGGDSSSANYLPFDFWAFVPKAVIEAEEGNYVNVKAWQLALLFAALNAKIGYSVRF